MENQKIVAVWLTRAERGDEKIRERLRALRAEYKPKKYTVCEYHSGDGDLKASVLDLLEYNKLRSAELLLKEDGSVQLIRRAETPRDYFATFDFCDILKDMKWQDGE